MIRCPWCGAQNYAIDSWCSKCQQHLDFGPRRRLKVRRRRAWSLLATLSAVLGVAIAMALPVASWFNGAQITPAAVLPKTALVPATPAVSSELPASASAEPAPSDEASPTAEPTPTDHATPVPVPTLGRPAIPPAGDPAAVVTRFYQAVSAHDFDAAAALWSTGLQAAYPPAEYIDHRFAATREIGVRTERVIAISGALAVVYVDIVELIGGQTRHWVGTWQLINSPSGWLLNQPNLRTAA
jgi:cytoskeletal protein RodZ